MKRIKVSGRKPRVMLLIPNQKWCASIAWSIHPYAVCSLMAMIKDKCEVGFVDANIENLSPDQTKARIAAFAPDILGVSILSSEYRESAFKACAVAKETNPEIVTVMGGVFVTVRPQLALSRPEVDYGVMGEGELVFPELIDFILGNKSEPPSAGVVLRTDDGLKILPQKEFIKDLDSLPLPDYSLVDYRMYSTSYKNTVEAPRALPYGKMMTSRGCPIGCVFCQVQYITGNKTRFKSVDRVIQEIQYLIDNFGIKSIEFEDDNLLGNVRRAKDLFRRMAEMNWDLVWNALNVSVFFLDEEMLDLMKAAKCQYLSLAIESGSPRVLKEIVHKPVDLQRAKRLADYARKIGLDTTSLFIIGFPGETWDEIRQTIRFAEYIGTDYVKINIATPFPGTKLYNLAVAAGVMDAGLDDDAIAWGKGAISTGEFTSDQLRILRAMEWERINFATEERREKLCKMMKVSMEELNTMRRRTIDLKLAAAPKRGDDES